MYAVIVTSGKQYKVAANDVLKIDRLDAEVGSIVQFDHVLALGGSAGALRLGTPSIEGVTVSAEVIEQKKDDKVLVFKKKRRHNYRRKNGHRQSVTVLRIIDVSGKGGTEKKAPAKKAAPKVEKAETKAEAPSENTAKTSASTNVTDSSGKNNA